LGTAYTFSQFEKCDRLNSQFLSYTLLSLYFGYSITVTKTLPMKEKILQFLKTKLTGVQESYLVGVASEYSKTITEEAQIETVLSDGVIDAIKFSATQVQAEGDRRANDAVRTAVENFRKKHNLDENGKPIQQQQQQQDPNEPDWFKAYREKQEKEAAELRQKVEGYEKKETVSALTAKVKAKLAEKKVPESFLKGRNLEVESEEQIEALVAQIEGDYTTFHQDLVNQGVVIEKPSGGGGDEGKSSIDDYLTEKFPESKN
jgi:hypothetical protein